jgi:MoxR-like ATPase
VTSDTSWRIYQGAGVQHDRIAELPPPPPWRRFDGEVLSSEATDVGFAAEPRPGAEDRARNYRPDSSVIDMVNAALFLRRPLLVTGRPGTGKSSLALSIAWELRLGSVLHWPITSRSQLQQSLYRYDAVGRLQEANLRRLGLGLGQQDGPPVTSAAPFITLGPLGTALVARERPRVLLIDEFDKSDIDLPNDLLNVLEEGQFAIPELAREHSDQAVELTTHDGGSATIRGGYVRAQAFPVIIITSNGERAFPDAFKRRCLQVTISEPDEYRLSEIVRSQLGAEALETSSALFRAFVDRRDAGANLPTDQLLNAVFLATSGLTDDPQTRQGVALALLQSGEAGDL